MREILVLLALGIALAGCSQSEPEPAPGAGAYSQLWVRKPPPSKPVIVPSVIFNDNCEGAQFDALARGDTYEARETESYCARMRAAH